MKKFSFITIVTALVFCLFIQPIDANTYNFKDVNQNNAHYNGIYTLANEGIINGYPDDKFRTGQTITRSQTAVLFTRSMNLSIPSDKANILKRYKDITTKHDYADAIAATYREVYLKVVTDTLMMVH